MNVASASPSVGTNPETGSRVIIAVLTFATIALISVPHGTCATPQRQRTSRAARSSAAEYSRAVTRVCTGALLFDHQHAMGTRADALAVARDIRASTHRRLARVTKLP